MTPSSSRANDARRTRANWRYVYEHYSADFDFFLFGGDDMYVLVENLRAYLRTDEFTRARIDNGEPLYLGRRFKARAPSLSLSQRRL